MIVRKSSRELAKMAAAGEVVAETLAAMRDAARPGVTTAELDRLAERTIRRRGGIPTFKGYRGFPGSICASPNDMIVHGIPGAYTLADGDVLSVDVGVTLRGFVADSAVTLPIGNVDPERLRLLETCQRSLFAAIEATRVGNHLSDIGHAVQTVVEDAGFSVVRALVGHGVGRNMHEDPQIPNYGAAGTRAGAEGGDGVRDRADDHGGRLGHPGGRRRLVDLHHRRLDGLALRAHRRGDVRRPAGATRPAPARSSTSRSPAAPRRVTVCAAAVPCSARREPGITAA